jgi:aminopeptidase N
MGYLYVKNYLGDSLFKKALHHYITQWQGKHPMPNDFFYSMNAGSGKNLNWFWKKWFFEPGMPDLAISSLKSTGNKHTITIANKGGKPVPVDILVTYNDGTTERIHRGIDVWEKGNTVTMLMFTGKRAIKKLLLGDPHTPDSNPADNTYEVK